MDAAAVIRRRRGRRGAGRLALQKRGHQAVGQLLVTGCPAGAAGQAGATGGRGAGGRAGAGLTGPFRRQLLQQGLDLLLLAATRRSRRAVYGAHGDSPSREDWCLGLFPAHDSLHGTKFETLRNNFGKRREKL